MSYQGLHFSFANMLREIENMRLLAKPFIDVDSFEHVIPDWMQDLSNFRTRGSISEHSVAWEIRETSPIKTRVSDGEYEQKKKKGAHKVFGRVSGKWQIAKAHVDGKQRKDSNLFFTVRGLASTKITIWSQDDEGQPHELARWTLDIGDAVSPGCHFHTQIDLDEEDHKFPKSLPVPRLPAFLHTPMDALDYLLGELFQDRWYERTSKGSDFVKNWSSCQRVRLINLLKWKSETIRDASGAPWTTLKKQKPAIDMSCKEASN